jgi:DNA-binding NtrC family response regulator
MAELTWKGEAPPKSLDDALKKAGWTVGTAAPRLRVVRTTSAALPANVERPWLWLVAAAVTPAMSRAAVDAGAVDVISTTGKAWEARVLARLAEAQVEEPAVLAPPHVVAHSAAAKALLRQIFQASQTAMPVLLTGETGTGKEVAARLIHQWSTRREKTFVPINCAAIPNELMEGELFGYAKGAFSGATRDYMGLLSAGHGGTVLLDEIDDTPFALQVKLLRVLEDRVVSRLGENEWHEVDYRLLAATNRDLRPLIAKGSFGGDLYERLATFTIELPPLRDRLDDLPGLLTQLMDRYYAEDKAAKRRARVKSVTPEALDVLRAYHWPGNIRELRNVVFNALVTKRAGEELLVSDLPRRLWAAAPRGESPGLLREGELEQRISAGQMNLRAEVEALERAALTVALRRAGGNAAEAARLLGEVGRGAARDPGGTVRTMMKRLGLGRSGTE